MNPDDYITGTFDERNPANQDEVETEQVTVDAWYYSDLQKIEKLTRRYFKLVDYPIKLTSDEVQELTEIRKKLKRLL